MSEPEIEVIVNEPEDDSPEVVVVESGGEGAVESAVALVEHVEEDTPKWVENAVEHERIWEAVRRLETPVVPVMVESEPVIEEIVEEAVEEALEETTESEVEIDIPPVDEEVVSESPGAKPWDVFSEIHSE